MDVAAPQIITAKRGREFAKDYNRINLDDTPDVKQAKLESWIAKSLGEKITALYPHRDWWINVDVTGGVAVIGCPDVSPDHGYFLKLDKTMNELVGRMKEIGGEILERGRMTRGRTTEDQVEAVARDVRNRVKGLDHG